MTITKQSIGCLAKPGVLFAEKTSSADFGVIINWKGAKNNARSDKAQNLLKAQPCLIGT